MKTILLKFAGPLQSWGTDSNFDIRRTDMHPSKSAVIGLVAASLGFRRDNDRDISRLNELDFAVRVDQEGALLKDYHTAHKYKSNGELERTYVTTRYYIEDAVFVVALSHSDAAWIDKIAYVLKNPYFQPFLGRRSLPLNADFFLGSFDGHAMDILSEYPWQAAKWYYRKYADKKPYLLIFADAHLGAHDRYFIRKDNVISFSQKERKFDFRTEIMLEIPMPPLDSGIEHDAFGAIGG